MATGTLARTARGIDRVCGWLNQLVTTAVGALLATIFTLLMVQVVMRYVVRFPLAWIEELTAFLAAYLALWGASVCLRNGSHVIVDTFYRMYPEVLRRIVTIFIYIVAIYFAYALYIGGMRLAELGAAEVSSSGYFNMYWPRLAVVSGAALIAVQAANLLFQEVASWFTGEPYYGGIHRRVTDSG